MYVWMCMYVGTCMCKSERASERPKKREKRGKEQI